MTGQYLLSTGSSTDNWTDDEQGNWTME